MSKNRFLRKTGSAIPTKLLGRTAIDRSESVQSGVKVRITFYNLSSYSSYEHFSHGTGGLHQIGGRDQVATTTEQPFGGRDLSRPTTEQPFGGRDLSRPPRNSRLVVAGQVATCRDHQSGPPPTWCTSPIPLPLLKSEIPTTKHRILTKKGRRVSYPLGGVRGSGMKGCSMARLFLE